MYKSLNRANKHTDAQVVPAANNRAGTVSGLDDNRPKSVVQQKQVQALANKGIVQPKKNTTGLPDKLKSGIENLSGIDVSVVKVHYNSDKPAQLSAHAYAQGTDIHVATGQEKYLPHEAWHVVQQKQGRVKPTLQMKGVGINDNRGLEKEADVMGAKALQRAVTIKNTETDTHVKAVAMPAYSIQKTAQTVAVAQLVPDKNALYWTRLVAKAGPAPAGLADHLLNYITNPVNLAVVGANVANAVALAHPIGVPVGILQLQATINGALAGTYAQPGQYAGDTAYNADLTGVLRANPFIQSVMNGTVHNQVPKRRGAMPVAVPAAQGAIGGVGGIVPGAHSIPAPAANADDRVLETNDLFNRLTNIPNALPPVVVNSIRGPHAAMGDDGNMDLGWAAARGNILHEFGHHLENNLGPADFATLHNFLTARVHVPPPIIGPAPAAHPMDGMRPEAGYFFENHPGYNIDMPEINAGGVAARPAPQTWWQRIKHGAARIKQSVTRAYHATPARYAFVLFSALKQQLGKLLSVFSRRRGPRTWGGNGVENFFVYNANNQNMSYSTVVHRFGGAGYSGSTEYLSTTVEFFNRPSHTRELVSVDPMRVALFLYLGNRPQYLLVQAAFAALPAPLPPALPRPNLDNLIHAVH